MKNLLIFLSLFVFINFAYAENIIITPVKKISTSEKSFQLGNTYEFKNIKNNDLYYGNVVFYQPNSFFGQEAQIEISNFTDSKGNNIAGKITIIPTNHKNFQEFMNYFSTSAFAFVRGSEISLKPNIHQFIINNTENERNLIIPIKPAQPISTCYDELEIGDIVEFTTIYDIHKNGKLYIKKDTPIFGIIDSVYENGWCADNATINFKKFKTTNINNQKITISADLTIDGFEILKFKSQKTKQFFNYISTFIRGKEVDIKKDDDAVKFILISE